MMKKLGGKTGAAAMKALLGGGMGGMGAPNAGGPNLGGMNAGTMPDLNALARGLGAPGQGLGGSLAKKLGGSLANGLPGLGGKHSGKKK